ncbi:hypothetical protein CLV91_2592 [Maribacter vaceletii]|uniref:Membrane metalloprotease n=1 Tax=Maribacter vaceletii TaxID=1206816 RepID=A0A495E712_9FLAO|nr:hypothetical protein [Maribacter vaceletii]RKR12461.1 hypothetical protein CLV91_2592 [Maribacter vaceletii]
MNKFRFLSIILVLGLLFSCSKKSDNEDEKPTKLVNKAGNLKGTGESANDILSNENFDELIIEVAYVKDFKPTDATIDNLTLFLKEHSFKQTIEVVYKELSSPNEETLTLEEINELEQENRTVYNDGKTLAFYIYFADAPSDEDDEEEDLVTLGAVYRNTSMVIYEKTIKKLSARSFVITTEDIETATLNHEFGHLFGLVNLGFEDEPESPLKTKMVNPHEDPEAQSHCTTDGCLMRAELSFQQTNKSAKNNSTNNLQASCRLDGISVLKMLESGKTSKSKAQNLGAECILDLKANGGR